MENIGPRGGNIPQTILTGERMNKSCFAPTPVPPTQLRRGITSSSRWELIFSLFLGGGSGGAGSRGTDSRPPLQRIQFPPIATAVNAPNDGWSPGSCMGVISALVSFFQSEIGWRASAQGFSPTLPRATQRGPSTYEHTF